MYPALAVIGRRLGVPSGTHDFDGTVHSLESDYSRSSDLPPWQRAVWWLAIAPPVALLAAAIMAMRIATSMLRAPHTRSLSASPLTYGLGGVIIGDWLARRRHCLIRVWRLDTPLGARLVRIAIPPSHPSDVRIGDTLRCWARSHRDGTFSADQADNLSSGERIAPARPSPLIVFAASGWTALLIVALLQVASAHA